MRGIDFFRDEIRNGFYIPTAIKQSWASELDVLDEIDRICEKHNITYFADWGTLLGAVRHGGIVPWDDDLDICMRREDYNRFLAIADKELPDGYAIHNYKRKKDHRLFLARVVNSERMCFEDGYLREHYNYPWLAGVDIFIKDYLYEDKDKERKRDKEIGNIIALADGITDESLSRAAVSKQLEDLRKRYFLKLPAKYHAQAAAVTLYELAEKLMSKVEGRDSDTIGQIFPWILKGQDGEPKEYYEKTLRLPFEDTTIPVPAYYHKVLNQRYPNYHLVFKEWDGHEYPAFEGQKAEMETLLGEELPHFTFERAMLERPPIDDSESLKTIAAKCMEELGRLIAAAENELLKGDIGAFSQQLTDAQQLAADLGTLTEQAKGEDSPYCVAVVNALQAFCDALWEEYQEAEAGDDIKKLPLSMAALDRLRETVRENIIERKEILYLPIGAREWETLSRVKPPYIDDKTDICVVPLPLLRKDMYGNILMTEAEIAGAAHIDEYPREGRYFDWRAYDIRLHRPQAVYIQNPYDDQNPCLTVPSEFYASYMRAYTEELIYVPIGRTAEFGQDDANDQYNLKHYVTAPGVVYADRVIVQSENIKEQYTAAMTRFAGEGTRELWEARLTAEGFPTEAIDEGLDKTRLLYCIGANELSEQRGNLLKAVNERIAMAKEYSDGISLSIALYPTDREQWLRTDRGLAEKLFEMVERAAEDGVSLVNIRTPDTGAEAGHFDAYYGSPSPIVASFIEQKKPVMLCDYGEVADEL